VPRHRRAQVEPRSRAHGPLRAAPRAGGRLGPGSRPPLPGRPPDRGAAASPSPRLRAHATRPAPPEPPQPKGPDPEHVRTGPEHDPARARPCLRRKPPARHDLSRGQCDRLLGISGLPSRLPPGVRAAGARGHEDRSGGRPLDPGRGTPIAPFEGGDRSPGGAAPRALGPHVELLRRWPKTVRPLRFLSPAGPRIPVGRHGRPASRSVYDFAAGAGAGGTGATVEVQNPQRVAFTGIWLQHSGHSRVVGAALAFFRSW
jgi:hypothetical protein